ncbi:M20/M25/M40 family metallo-hydrolase [Lacihabitans sp. LS3-19]|uniref:M20/M25/M40 family metallo-hydrolase n=1 Tax=Lacihabitans sp. LS3-19 TaxID=2487335 RepID=UPI0020CB85C4|nr:M20/M25/M40 family metallo-hydrolase [Lacihabitans sp. LS3-19]MCP9766496.1 M20/M25/M40 family metallo-hydrolase [Lacihabitans sp. LS3-19]
MKIFLVILLCFNLSAWGQKLSKKEIQDVTKSDLKNSLETFREFLKLPNDGNYPTQIRTNLTWCEATFKDLGFKTQEIVSDGIPHLYAEYIVNPSLKNVLFYLQIDGQPVDSTAWNQKSPFEPVLKNKEGKEVSWLTLAQSIDLDYKIFARSASDSKGPAMCFITALKSLKKLNIKPEYNIKVIMDFQEELSSPTIASLVKKHRTLLDADRLVIMDGTRHISNIPTIMFGARGIATATLTVFGAKENLHSGQYGNYAPNPAFKLAKLLAGMKDDDGRVIIPGFYDGVEITAADKKSFAEIPENMADLNAEIGIAEAEKVGESYQEAMQFPSLNIRGMRAAWVGKEVRTTIPNMAIAELDLRLVPETPGPRQMDLIRKYLVNNGVTLIDSFPTDEQRAKYKTMATFKQKEGSLPFRTPMDSEIGSWLGSAMLRAVDQHIKVRATGGSQPMASFIETLNVPAVSLRIPNPDNNIHGPNENIRIGNYEEGIRMVLAVLTQKL